MSYQLLRESKPKARKDYRCIWCPEKILKGEIHLHEISKYDGEFQDHRWHLECNEAFVRHYQETGEEEIYPHASARGSAREAGDE